jgi:hypothetical protein
MFKLLIIGAVAVVIIAGASGWYIIDKAMQETITPLQTLNPTSNGSRAIIIYSPGVSDFHQKITESFASGLIAAGWNVDMVTASSQTITNLSSYSLLVIGAPIHGKLPSKPLMDYMARVNKLDGIRVYTLLSSMGGGPQGEHYVSEWITSRGGDEIGMLSLSTMSKNTPVEGATEPIDISYETALNIQKIG